MHAEKVSCDDLKDLSNSIPSGSIPVYVSINGKLSGIICVADNERSESKNAISKIRQLGIEVAILTGDQLNSAEFIASKIGINKIHAGILPEEKAAIIKDYQKKGFRVGMVGDGINDAPALAQADIGFAMGAGTDVAMENSDIILIQNDLNKVTDALKLSRATLINIRQNLFWAFGYNLIGIPIAAGLLVSFGGPALDPIIAAGAMAFSSVSVVMNSLRLRSFSFSKN